MNKEVSVKQEKIEEAVSIIMSTLQDHGYDELTAYMAMISITNAMEEKLGLGYERKKNS